MLWSRSVVRNGTYGTFTRSLFSSKPAFSRAFSDLRDKQAAESITPNTSFFKKKPPQEEGSSKKEERNEGKHEQRERQQRQEKTKGSYGDDRGARFRGFFDKNEKVLKVLLPVSVSFAAYVLARQQQREAHTEQLDLLHKFWESEETVKSLARVKQFYLKWGGPEREKEWNELMAELDKIRPVDRATLEKHPDKRLLELLNDFSEVNDDRRRLLIFWISFMVKYTANMLDTNSRAGFPGSLKAQNFIDWVGLLDQAHCYLYYSKSNCIWPNQEPPVYKFLRDEYIPWRTVLKKRDKMIGAPARAAYLAFWKVITFFVVDGKEGKEE